MLVIVSTNLLSKGSTFSILRRGVGAGVGGATTLGPDLGGEHSASIEPGGSTASAFEISCGCMLNTICARHQCHCDDDYDDDDERSNLVEHQ